MVSSTSFYQFRGPDSFSDLFDKYADEHYVSSNMKIFPTFFGNTRLQHIKNQDGHCFGWMSGAGYVTASSADLESYITDFTVVPFIYYNKAGILAADKNPTYACQSKHHLFFQFEDSLVVVSKITSNIVFSEVLG